MAADRRPGSSLTISCDIEIQLGKLNPGCDAERVDGELASGNSLTRPQVDSAAPRISRSVKRRTNSAGPAALPRPTQRELKPETNVPHTSNSRGHSGPGRSCGRGNLYLRNSSGGLAMFAAMRRPSMASVALPSVWSVVLIWRLNALIDPTAVGHGASAALFTGD